MTFTEGQLILFAAIWFAVGLFFATLFFLAKTNKSHFKFIKKNEDLIERNNELLEQNMRLISFNNQVLMEVRELKDGVNRINELLS